MQLLYTEHPIFIYKIEKKIVDQKDLLWRIPVFSEMFAELSDPSGL